MVIIIKQYYFKMVSDSMLFQYHRKLIGGELLLLEKALDLIMSSVGAFLEASLSLCR